MKFRDVETSRYSSAISGDHGSPFPWLKRGNSYCRFVWLSKLVKCVHGCDLGFGVGRWNLGLGFGAGIWGWVWSLELGFEFGVLDWGLAGVCTV